MVKTHKSANLSSNKKVGSKKKLGASGKVKTSKLSKAAKAAKAVKVEKVTITPDPPAEIVKRKRTKINLETYIEKITQAVKK